MLGAEERDLFLPMSRLGHSRVQCQCTKKEEADGSKMAVPYHWYSYI